MLLPYFFRGVTALPDAPEKCQLLQVRHRKFAGHREYVAEKVAPHKDDETVGYHCEVRIEPAFSAYSVHEVVEWQVYEVHAEGDSCKRHESIPREKSVEEPLEMLTFPYFSTKKKVIHPEKKHTAW